MRCELLCSSSGEHLSQVFTGFALLAQQRRAEVRLTKAAHYDPGVVGSSLRVVVDGGRRVVYDVRDHNDMDVDDLAWCDLYFKRSYDRTVAYPEKVHPLGFNYPVYTDRDWWIRRSLWSIRHLRRNNVMAVAARVGRLLPFAPGVDAGKTTGRVLDFEAGPGDDGSVLLLTRTWDPAGQRSERAAMRAAMNATRVNAIRALREAFGDRFRGGLMASPDAIRSYPDCVVDREITNKRSYLRLMQRAAVCIATTGLVGSTGWRVGEFIAASRAFVTEPLNHRVPGPFAEGPNYLSFRDTDELVASVTALLDDGDRRQNMQRANHEYYRAHLRPDVLVLNTLAVAVGDDTVHRRP